jgi:DNA-binding Lrp family transcriptional regulator
MESTGPCSSWRPSVRPDAIDSKILEALMDDARASLRQVARRTSLTTPTVSARLARMMRSGLIKKFVPVISADSLNRGVLALVTVKVPPASAQKTADDLAKLREVEAVYMTTGQGITLKVDLDNVQQLQAFLAENLLNRRGVEVLTSQVITSTVKEEPPSIIPGMLVMDLKCDYCGGEVTSSRPYTMTVGSTRYYFCCKTCKRGYLDKHARRLAKIAGRKGETGELEA